ncbi:MAG: site-specific integrase, partial [Alphaproteobacteria bacterium]|nr:site-specific integrase [Alphaproteobacteria bacterium]
MTLDAAREAWRDWLKSERRLAAHTLVAYEHDVAGFLGFLTGYLGAPPTLDALARLKPAEFRAWLTERARQGMARTSTARAFSSVRSFFAFLDKRGLAHTASIQSVQTPKLPRSVPKALSERDMEDVLDAAPEQERAAWIDLRDSAIFLLLYGAG